MKELLELLGQNARLSNAELAAQLSLTEAAVEAQIYEWEKDGTIRGYRAMVDPAQDGKSTVTAFIEVKVTPERGGGFDRVGKRIARLDKVRSCFLASGGYDLLVLIEGDDLMAIATFVAEKLSPIDGVVSCATHFRLKSYKENGFLFMDEEGPERLPVSP